MRTDQPSDRGEPADTTLEVVDLWLRNSGVFAEPLIEPPSTLLLTRYLCGALSETEAHEVERGLVAHAQARANFDAVGTVLDALPERSWVDVATQARREDLAGEVAREWQSLMAARSASMADAPATWLAAGWDGIRQGVAEGTREAQTAWVALLAFSEQFRLALRTPRLAVVKGLSGDERVTLLSGELPAGTVPLLVAAEVETEGALYVRLRLVDTVGQPTEAVSGLSLTLALVVNGEQWPLSTIQVGGTEVSWRLPELGSMLNLSPGSLPTACLGVLAASNSEGGAAPAGEGTLLASVLDSQGRTLASPPVALRILDAPRWEEEQFTMRLSVPPAIRLAYGGHSLVLELPATPLQGQRLGTWLIRDWGDEPRLLSVACPGSNEALLPRVSLLRAYLRPSE